VREGRGWPGPVRSRPPMSPIRRRYPCVIGVRGVVGSTIYKTYSVLNTKIHMMSTKCQ
jgi:hypothetical protein